MISISLIQHALLCSAVAGLAGSDLGQKAAPRVRNFLVDYKAVVKHVPAGSTQMDLWLPVPHNDSYQQITGLRIDSSQAYTILPDANGNTILHVGMDDTREESYSVEISFQAAREEHEQPRLSKGPPLANDENPRQLEQWLKPDRLVPLNDQIRTWAREVVTAAHAHTDLEMARAIYDHVVSTVKYDKSGKGWGRGDIYYACEKRRGNCTDFHSMFIGYCRALGIPARFAIGFPLPPDRGQGKLAGYHCWAEFYAHGIGWIPIDASEAAKNPDKREYFFGHHDENRIEFTRGRDLVLSPRQQSDPLNYFIYPYAEIDGKAYTEIESTVTFRDRGALQSATLH